MRIKKKVGTQLVLDTDAFQRLFRTYKLCANHMFIEPSPQITFCLESAQLLFSANGKNTNSILTFEAGKLKIAANKKTGNEIFETLHFDNCGFCF